jgi:hypothetical protein
MGHQRQTQDTEQAPQGIPKDFHDTGRPEVSPIAIGHIIDHGESR